MQKTPLYLDEDMTTDKTIVGITINPLHSGRALVEVKRRSEPEPGQKEAWSEWTVVDGDYSARYLMDARGQRTPVVKVVAIKAKVSSVSGSPYA